MPPSARGLGPRGFLTDEEKQNTPKITKELIIRILKYLKPDYVHILKDGQIIKSGDINLALDIEKNGYTGINVVSEDEAYE